MSSSSALDSRAKPWLSPAGQVAHLKGKGVRFELISEQEAEAYLTRNNNYFRLRSFGTGFPKVEGGSRAGKYVNLDFKMLVDLSIVDMLLRYEMLPMALDIEHFTKVGLLGRIAGMGEDGYAVVADFLASYDRVHADGSVGNRLKSEIEKGRSSSYVAGLLERYPNHGYPVWAFLEVLTFGTFLQFYRFCADRFANREMRNAYYLLQAVKGLRNACAHNNCILNDLASGTAKHNVQPAVSQALARIGGIGAGTRKSKMSNERVQQITTTLYVHQVSVSDGVRKSRSKSLHEFVGRMNRHAGYYRGNLQVSSAFGFLSKVIDAWYPL